MAIYSLSHSPIGRSTHAAGTAGAHIHYITREGAQSDHAERLPEGIESDRASVKGWIDREEMADRANARVVDKLMVALPKELDREQRLELVREYCDKVTQERTPYYAAIHAGPKDADNPHAHIVIRDRDLETGKRVIQSSEKGSTERFRAQWEAEANRALERAGRAERIDRRSLREQGLEREPSRHEGPNVRSMEEKGIPTRIGEENRNVRAYNQVRAEERGAVIDYQKAKAELGAERDIHERHQARMRTGTWDEEGSRAVAQVERALGGPVEPGVMMREARESQSRLDGLLRQERHVTSRMRELDRLGGLAERERQAWAQARGQQKHDESLKGRVVNWWNGRDAAAVQETRRVAGEHANRFNAYLNEAGHKTWENMARERERAAAERDQVAREKASETERRDLYGPAAEGIQRHGQKDPEIQHRHRERLQSGVWTRQDSRHMSRLELEAGGPVTREWLDARIAKAPDGETRGAYYWGQSAMDDASRLKDYQQGREQGGPSAERDPGMEKELKEIKLDVRHEVNPGKPEPDLGRDLVRDLDLGRGGRGGR